MSRTRRFAAALVAAVMLGQIGGLAITATGAWAKTCQSPAGNYEYNPLPPGDYEGADPAGIDAANCALGFREDTTYPLSVIGLCLLATVGTLLLLRRGTSYDPVGSQA
jgi:hypothetical protein